MINFVRFFPQHVLRRLLSMIVISLVILQLLSLPAYGSAPSLEETISRRRSTHQSGTYTDQNVTQQELLKVLWAAYGYTSSGHRSLPSIGGNYSLIIYVANATGSYRYIPKIHSIVLHDQNVTKETLFNPQKQWQVWPKEASAVLVILWNKTRMGNGYFAAAEAGCLVQNVYLEANCLNLGTCCVSGVNSTNLRTDLHLPLDLIPLLVMPLGYRLYYYPPASPNYSIMDGNLPPVLYSNTSLEEAIMNRMSVNEWSSENLSSQELSQLLWAAYGSANTTHRTTPSAGGIYPLIVYVLNSTGVYRYVPEIEKETPELFHFIDKTLEEDKRYEVANACSGETWAANAPTILLVAYNSSFNNGHTGDGSASGSGLNHENIEVDAGCVIQNIFLEASAWNLGTTVLSRGLEDWNETGAANIRNILNLTSDIVPLYVMPVGHERARAHLVVRGLDNRIYYRVYDSSGGSWESWDVVPVGATCDSPAAAVCCGRLHIVVRGMDGYSLWYGWINLTDNSFPGWTRLSGSTPSAPTLTSNGTALCLVVRGFNDRIHFRSYDCASHAWEQWNAVPTGATCDSPAAAMVCGSLHVVVRGMDEYSLWHGHFTNPADPASFSGWTRLSGATPSAPTLASDGTVLSLVVRGFNDRIYYRVYESSWGGWNVLPGATCDSPAAAMLGDDLHVVVRGMDGNTLWHGYLSDPSDPESFSGWSWLSGATPSAPTLTSVRAQLLAPYIGLAILLAVVVTTLFYVKKRNHLLCMRGLCPANPSFSFLDIARGQVRLYASRN